MRHPVLATLALVLLSTGCALPAGSPQKPPTVTDYRIGPPDVLEVSIRPEPAITRNATVRPDGRISLDLIGDVQVAGKTIQEVEADITNRIAEYIVHPDVTVTLAESNSRKIYVLGEVGAPGDYPIIGKVDVLDAFGTAGGRTRFSKLDTARLVRPGIEGQRVFQVNLAAITLYGDSATNYELQPGDVLFVPPNGFARVGYAVGILLFPLQQVLGFGAQAYNQAQGGGNNTN